MIDDDNDADDDDDNIADCDDDEGNDMIMVMMDDDTYDTYDNVILFILLIASKAFINSFAQVKGSSILLLISVRIVHNYIKEACCISIFKYTHIKYIHHKLL